MQEFRIGDLLVTRIDDFVDPNVDPKFLLPDLPDDVIPRNIQWLAPRFYNISANTVAIHMQSWLIRTKHHSILVDTCGGNHKHREHFPIFHMRSGPYLDNLRAAGVSPDDIDFVFCTHLHIDHVGWNTRLENGRWVPTFRNAKYLFSKKDYEAADPRQRMDGGRLEADVIFEDSVLPVIDAGLAVLVGECHAIDDNLAIEAAAGHSPGHSLLRASHRGQTGLFTGDALHHPIQIAAPRCNSFACSDPDAARQTRLRVLEDCAENGHLLIPGHFAAPHRGRIRHRAEGFEFLPE